MRLRPEVVALGVAGGFISCRPQPVAEPPPPVVEARPAVEAVVPVPTRPFEEGYDFGFTLAQKEAQPRTPIPDEATAAVVAHQHATGNPARTERWERGFVEGYRDGYRNVVTGQK